VSASPRFARALLGSLAASMALALAAPDARGCASCGCGDPTLTAVGVEKPTRGRLRASLELRRRSDEIGAAGVDAIALEEHRLDAQVAYSPHERATLLLAVPTLQRHVRYVNLGETTTRGLGDVELRAKLFLYQERAFSPRHLVAVTAGLKLPTAPWQRGPDGVPLPVEVQPGTGSWDPALALSYAHFAAPWSFYASVQGTYPAGGREGGRASRSLRATSLLQRQWQRFGLRGGVEGRLDGKSLEGGIEERDSGGGIGFAALEGLFNPAEDLLLFVAIRVPAIERLAGFHHEGTVWSAGIAYDL
jgi:hypothetical protein